MRLVRAIVAIFATLLALAAPAQEPYPSRSVRLVIDTSPGGVTDLFGRLAAEALTAKLGQTVYVDNKPGASGNVAIDFLVRSAPDGYTLMIASGGGIVVKPFLERGLTFDVMNDLVPVVNFAAGAKHRLTNLPDVPSAAEAGVGGWEMSAWFGVFAPRGTSPEIVRALNDKLQAVIEDPKLRQRLHDAGAEPVGGSAESFAERYRADHRMWGQFIRETGIKTE